MKILKKFKQKVYDFLYEPYIAQKNQWIFLKQATKLYHDVSVRNEVREYPFSEAKNAFLNAKNGGHLDKFNRPTNNLAADFMKVWA